MKAKVSKDGMQVRVSLSHRNIERMKYLEEVGRMPGLIRAGSIDDNEPLLIVALEDDATHYGDAADYEEGKRCGGNADLVQEMIDVLLETDELLSVGEDPGTTRLQAVVDRLRGRADDDVECGACCDACGPCNPEGCAAENCCREQ